MNGTVVGTIKECSKHCELSEQDLLQALFLVTVECTAGEGHPGLAVPCTTDFLAEQCALSGARLSINFQNELVTGFSLYHVDQRAFPRPLENVDAHFGRLGRLGYGQLVAVRPAYRGSKFSLYDELMRNSLENARQNVDIFLSLVRDGNESARAAHVRRGWMPSGVVQVVKVEGAELAFEYLLFVVSKQDAQQIQTKFRELAGRIGTPYSLRELAAGSTTL